MVRNGIEGEHMLEQDALKEAFSPVEERDMAPTHNQVVPHFQHFLGPGKSPRGPYTADTRPTAFQLYGPQSD